MQKIKKKECILRIRVLYPMKSIIYLHRKTTILLLKKKSSQYSRYQQKLANRNRIKQKISSLLQKRSSRLRQSLIKTNRENSLNPPLKITKTTNKILIQEKMNLRKKLILLARITLPIQLLKETMKT